MQPKMNAIQENSMAGEADARNVKSDLRRMICHSQMNALIAEPKYHITQIGDNQ